jgi:hypothetical protein
MTDAEAERRIGQKPVPGNLKALLTDLQAATLNQLENFGWSLAFVRRINLPSPIVVVEGPLPRQYGVLHRDGILDQTLNIGIR